MTLHAIRTLIDKLKTPRSSERSGSQFVLRPTTNVLPTSAHTIGSSLYTRRHVYGHTDETGAFFLTTSPHQSIIESHVNDLVTKVLARHDPRYSVSKSEAHNQYEYILAQALILEPVVYRTLSQAIAVERPFSCVSAFTRMFAPDTISGKRLGEVRSLVELVSKEYSVPKEGDI